MSHQMITSQLCVALSDEQQEVVTGGIDFELAGSNYANRTANLRGFTTSGPYGSFANSSGTNSEVNTAGQDFLVLGAPSVPAVAALGAAPILGGVESGTLGVSTPDIGTASEVKPANILKNCWK